MRVADYIAERLYDQGVSHVFMVTGGGMMFLSDGVACHEHLEAVCTHHEQACAMAAVGYAKYTNEIGACYITTGCGGTNAMTGLLNAWQDNIPCVFISGQCKRKETVRNSDLPLRQFGVQEADIIALVEPMTKYAVMVNDPEKIAYHMDKAIYLAKNSRPGPVWLDVPLDVQGANVLPDVLERFEGPTEDASDALSVEQDIKELAELIEKAERPVVLAGQGVRLGKAIDELKEFVGKFSVPVVTSKLGADLLTYGNPLFVGSVGNKGTRAGNMAMQNADLLISIGCRLSVSSTGHEYDNFAREATIVVVDIDPIEHKKNTVRIDKFIHADAKKCLSGLIESGEPVEVGCWVEKCQAWKKKYPVCQPEYADDSEGINLYYFVESLSQAMDSDDVVVTDAGSAGYVGTQGIRHSGNQRTVTTGGQMEMGYTVPAAIGVCYANKKKRVIGITGDGSFQMNIQELQTIVHHDLPIKLFVWNNDGYLSIRATQRKFFDERYIGTDSTSGVSFPELEKIANAYGMEYCRLDKTKDLAEAIGTILDSPKAVLCEVMCIRDQEIIPSVSSMRKEDGTMVSKPLEDMYPFLEREEFLREMIVKPIDES